MAVRRCARSVRAVELIEEEFSPRANRANRSHGQLINDVGKSPRHITLKIYPGLRCTNSRDISREKNSLVSMKSPWKMEKRHREISSRCNSI